MDRKFACRKCPEKAYIYTVKVSFDNIIYFTNDREESEVLDRPENKVKNYLNKNLKKLIQQSILISRIRILFKICGLNDISMLWYILILISCFFTQINIRTNFM